MRRSTRRSLRNPLIALALFLVILYTFTSGSSKGFYDWHTIRYRSISTGVQEKHGICPGLAESLKPALVVARVIADGDVDWIASLADLYQPCIYTADSPDKSTSTHLQTPANRGHEAMAYLTFIIDNYNQIPAAGALFVHGSRFAWHNDWPDYDNKKLLRQLNVSNALAGSGYHNLRCDWSSSTCLAKDSPPQASFEVAFRAFVEPWDARMVSDKALPPALVSLFGGREAQGVVQLARSDAVRAQCCAQFVVARDRIWQHSREEYVALRQWLLDGSSGRARSRSAAPADDRVAGRILSYLWHILFTDLYAPDGSISIESLNSQACPAADECYCRLYGRCDLKDCNTPARCHGQYTIPPFFKLPQDWPSKHP